MNEHLAVSPDVLVSISDELDSIELEIASVMEDRAEFVELGQHLLDRLGELRCSIEREPACKAARGRRPVGGSRPPLLP